MYINIFTSVYVIVPYHFLRENKILLFFPLPLLLRWKKMNLYRFFFSSAAYFSIHIQRPFFLLLLTSLNILRKSRERKIMWFSSFKQRSMFVLYTHIHTYIYSGEYFLSLCVYINFCYGNARRFICVFQWRTHVPSIPFQTQFIMHRSVNSPLWSRYYWIQYQLILHLRIQFYLLYNAVWHNIAYLFKNIILY